MSEVEMDLEGRSVLVTGAGEGIGRALAGALALRGATVVAVDSAFPEGDEPDQADVPARPRQVRADVANPYSVERLAREVTAYVGAPHVLVNGAGVWPVASVVEMDPGEWDRALAMNLRGPYLMCRAFLPGMLERGSGIIVNLVSGAAMPFASAYIASKQGLLGLTQSLAAEVGEQGICVVAFDPGIVDTPGLRETGRVLAPRLGLTLTQFMEPAVPADRAAAAAVHLIGRYSIEYHGQVVTGQTVLDRVAAEEAPPEPGSEIPAPAHPVSDFRTRSELIGEAQRLTARLQAILDHTVTELDRAPVLARPLAKRGFRRRTGQDPEYWARLLTDLQGRLRRADRMLISGQDRGKREHAGVLEGLQTLRRYYAEAPEECSRLSRDEEGLRYVSEQSAERVAVIDSLSELLERLQT